MYQHKLEKVFIRPLEYGFEVLGGKWKNRIICTLEDEGSLRYGALRKEIEGISDAVLAATLKELMADGLVERKQYAEIPPRVEYSLTEKGLSVIPLFSRICQWKMSYHKDIEETMLPKCQNCQYCERNTSHYTKHVV